MVPLVGGDAAMAVSADPQPPPEAPRDRSNTWLLAVLVVLAIAVAVLATLLATGRFSEVELATTATGSPTPSAEGTPTGSVETREDDAAETAGGSSADDTVTDLDGGSSGGSPADMTIRPAEACAPDAVLALVGGQVDGIPVTVVDMVCTATDGGRAWLRLAPPPDPPIGNLDLYLVERDGSWEVAGYGQGLRCTDAGFSPAACAALRAAGADVEAPAAATLRCDRDDLLAQIPTALGRGDVELRHHECTTVGGPGTLALYAYPIDHDRFDLGRAHFAIEDGWQLRAWGGQDCADAGLSPATCAALEGSVAEP